MNKLIKHISMRDVALAAGVSIAAVSKAINNKSDISENVRKKILMICDKLGYQVNTSIQDMVRNRRSGETKNLAFIIVEANFSTPAYSSAIDGVALAAKENGLHLILDHITGEESSRYDLPPILRDGRIDGIILTGTLNCDIVSLVHNLKIPYVILGAYSKKITEGSVNVLLDTSMSIELIVRELKANGKSRIAYLTEDSKTYYERECLNSFKTALVENELDVLDELFYFGKGDALTIFTKMEKLFMLKKLPFDSIVCLDFRTAQKLSYLIKAYYGIGKVPEITIGTLRSSCHDTLPEPTVYGEMLFDKVSYEGVNALLDIIANKKEAIGRKILLNP